MQRRALERAGWPNGRPMSYENGRVKIRSWLGRAASTFPLVFRVSLNFCFGIILSFFLQPRFSCRFCVVIVVIGVLIAIVCIIFNRYCLATIPFPSLLPGLDTLQHEKLRGNLFTAFFESSILHSIRQTRSFLPSKDSVSNTHSFTRKEKRQHPPSTSHYRQIALYKEPNTLRC